MKVQELVAEVLRDKETVVMVRDHRFCVEVVYKSMAGKMARQNLDRLRATLRRLNSEADFSVVPPYSPEHNLVTGPCFTMFKAIWASLEEVKGTHFIDKTEKPTTTWPVAGGALQAWSLEFNEKTIISAIYDSGSLAMTAHARIWCGRFEV